MNVSIKQLLVTLAQIAPNRYIQALLIIILFFGLAKFLDVIVTRFIRKWFVKTKLTIDDQVLNIFHKPVFASIILFGLALATERLAFNATVTVITLSGVKTIAIFLWAIAAAKFAQLLLSLVSRDESQLVFIQDRTLPLFNNLLILIVVALSIYFVFLAWDIDVTAWFSGVFIVADAPYQLGDFIVLDSGERGEVTTIGIRSTRLLTRDDVEITVPNSIMGNAKITNEAVGPHEKYRIRVKVGVAYGSDIDKVHQVLFDVAQNHPNVCTTPEPRVRFRAFGDSSLDHELLCWVEKPVLRGRVLHALNTQVYKQFQENNIEIPFPQRDVHIRSNATQELSGDTGSID
jgi:MscS family membrane protein